MRWRGIGRLGLLVLATCGSPKPPESEVIEFQCGAEPALIPPKGGTRLRPRVLVDEAGLAFPFDVLDTSTGEACVPTRRQDGAIVCLPGVYPIMCRQDATEGVHLVERRVDVGDGLEALVYAGADGSRVPSRFFNDVGHRVTVMIDTFHFFVGPWWLLPLPFGGQQYSSDPMCAPAADPLFPTDGCMVTDETTHVRIVESIYSTTPEDVTGYLCVHVEGQPFPYSRKLRALRGKLVPIEEWKQATPVRGAGTGRYRFEAFKVGCSLVRSDTRLLIDTALDDLPCSVDVDHLGNGRCLPYEFGQWGYADAECTQPIVVVEPGVAKPRYKRDEETGIYEVGDELLPELLPAGVYLDLNGTCRPWTEIQVNGWKTYARGAFVPPETFGMFHLETR